MLRLTEQQAEGMQNISSMGCCSFTQPAASPEPRFLCLAPAGGENAGDAFYRYKMPKLQARVGVARLRGGRNRFAGAVGKAPMCHRCRRRGPLHVASAAQRRPARLPPAPQIEGRGNGIKTNVVNNAEIAKALERPADCELCPLPPGGLLLVASAGSCAGSPGARLCGLLYKAAGSNHSGLAGARAPPACTSQLALAWCPAQRWRPARCRAPRPPVAARLPHALPIKPPSGLPLRSASCPCLQTP